MSKENNNKLRPDTWVDQYSDYLFNYAIVRVNEKELAWDLIQETFLSALSSANSFEGRSTEKTWLVSILKRKIIDYYRKASTRREQKIIDKNFMEGKEDLPFHSDGNQKGMWKVDQTPADWKISADAAIENQELSKIIQSCIGRLPTKWAAVFTMRMIEEIESDDVCKELDISSSNLWVILHRARLQLRECVEKNWIL